MKRNIKTNFLRKVNYLFIILLTVICLFGCHGQRKTAPFEMPDSFDTSRNYEITFWAKNDTNLTQKKIYNKAISDFEQLYPNIKVNIKSYTDYNTIYNDAITNIRTNTTPNVCISYPDHVATYLSGDNVIVKLDDLMNDSKYGLGGSELLFDSVKKDEIVTSFMNECIIKDEYYLLPFMRSTEALYINKDYVNRLGYDIPDIVTWDYVWEVSEKAMEDYEHNKTEDSKSIIPFIYKSTDNMMIQMIKQKNSGYSNGNGDILIFNDTTTSLLLDLSKHCQTDCFSTFKISSYPGNTFNKGRCLFAIDSTAGATWMGSNAPLLDIHQEEVVPFETIVRPIPQYDVNNVQMISQGPSICLFNKSDPQEVLASWLFMQFLITNSVQIAYSETEGYVPVTYKAQNTSEYQTYLSKRGEDNNQYYDVKIDATNILLNNLDNTFVTPVFNGSASLRNASGQMIEEVVKNVKRGVTIDEEFIKKLYEEVSSLYLKNKNNNGNDNNKSLGKLPVGSIVLISSIAIIWIGLSIYFVITFINKRKYEQLKRVQSKKKQ